MYYVRKMKFLVVLVLAAALCFSLTACAGQGNSDQVKKNQDKELKIGVFNWAENIAVCNMWKLVLEEEGYNVKLVDGQKQTLFSAVASGDLDLAVEVWLPKTDEPFMAKYKNNGWELMEPWYEGTGLGLVVPEYMDINSIEELNENKDKFVREGNPSIVGIGGGASIMRMTEEAIDKYNLEYDLIESSGPAMTAALDKAINKEDPVVVTLWNPHWVFADYNLKYLEDPKKVYGGEEKIYCVGHTGFSDKFPTLTRWLNNWHMDDQSLGSLMSVINDTEDPAEGAKKWLDNNQDLVDTWLR
ncbi:MAG: glycine betaine ABC transporter substrate-binding protein [Clostridiales bacterium]|nr:glycine betaine ABC transporter substrate-binding protein [Clostridiales bacterium]MCF8023469.1 glycine betaine ABC transporter substrate-binding protein [Clostridiales bacterium]